MPTGWTTALQRQDFKPLPRAQAGHRRRSAGGRGGFTLIGLLAAVGGVALTMVSTSACAAEWAEPDLVEQTLGVMRECMAETPPPWAQAWQAEYVDTVRGILASHRQADAYSTRLEIVRQAFPSYWKGLRKGPERSLFEVHQAEIRWYVESLMSVDLPKADEKQKLRGQYHDLLDYAAGALLRQFSFLDPNLVEKAKADQLAECDRYIDAPLLPVFLHPFSEQQIERIKQRWHDLRYVRVDLWRQFGGGRAAPAPKMPAPSGSAHPDYLLTQRSLAQLRGQMWSLVGPPPEYYRDAAAKGNAAPRQRLQAAIDARSREQRLGVAVWQTEYLSFLLTALLETAREPEP